MSLGRDPYGKQSFDEVLEQLNEGYRLPFPSDITDDSRCYLQTIYLDISSAGFVAEPNDRCNFLDVVKMIEAEMTELEKFQHTEMARLYQKEKADRYLRMGQKNFEIK